MSKWIAITDRLPKRRELSEDGEVLVCWGNECEFLSVASRGVDGKWYDTNVGGVEGELYDVTHWMRLPKPPPNRQSAIGNRQ